MSQGKSIFSNPSSSNGEAPANPFASLGASKASSPFSAAESATPAAAPASTAPAAEAASPFGFADVAPAEQPKARMPEKQSAPAEKSDASAPKNPFMTASPAPVAEPESSAAASFAPNVGFEAPAEQKPKNEAQPTEAAPADKGGFGFEKAPANPLSSSPMTPPAVPTEAAPVQKEASSSPSVDSPVPAQAQAAAPAQPAQASAPSHSAAPVGAESSPRQLALRAIFGVEGEMSREDMLQRAKGLQGIREVAVVGASEMNAFQAIGGVMSRFGYGGDNSWQVTCSGGVVDFIVAEGATLAVLREGRYAAGVWETLSIVASEMGKLG